MNLREVALTSFRMLSFMANTNGFGMKKSFTMQASSNLLGAIVTVGIYVLYILMLILRLLSRPEFGHRIASVQFLAVIPLVYLLLKAPRFERPLLY